MPPRTCGWCRGRLAPNATTIRVEPGGLRIHADHLIGAGGTDHAALRELDRILGVTYREDGMTPATGKAKAKVKAKAAPDPWDEIEKEAPASDLPPFATEAERAELAGKIVTITAIRNGETQYGEAWYLDAETPIGPRTLTVSAGIEARDRLIAALAERLPIKARWVRRGPAYWIERP